MNKKDYAMRLANLAYDVRTSLAAVKDEVEFLERKTEALLHDFETKYCQVEVDAGEYTDTCMREKPCKKHDTKRGSKKAKRVDDERY